MAATIQEKPDPPGDSGSRSPSCSPVADVGEQIIDTAIAVLFEMQEEAQDQVDRLEEAIEKLRSIKRSD